jgi:hypothetical protein
MRAQLQNRFVIKSPFVALILNKGTALVLRPGIARFRLPQSPTTLQAFLLRARRVLESPDYRLPVTQVTNWKKISWR